MTATTVQYHAGRAAINVKLHAAGDSFWPPVFYGDVPVEIGSTTEADLVDAAYNITQSYFWAVAADMAAPVLGPIYADGRSGGWLVFEQDPTHGGEDDPTPEWLAEYRALAEWCAEFLAAAPGKVAALAHDLAMDEVGRAAAGRMFAFDRLVTA